MNVTNIAALNLTFGTNTEDDKQFIMESFVMLGTTMALLASLRQVGNRLAELAEKGAEADEIQPLVETAVEMQSTLMDGAGVYAVMIRERLGIPETSTIVPTTHAPSMMQ